MMSTKTLAEKEGHGLIGCAGAGNANCSNSSKQFVLNTDFHSVPDGLVYGPQTQQPCCTQLRGQ